MSFLLMLLVVAHVRCTWLIVNYNFCFLCFICPTKCYLHLTMFLENYVQKYASKKDLTKMVFSIFCISNHVWEETWNLFGQWPKNNKLLNAICLHFFVKKKKRNWMFLSQPCLLLMTLANYMLISLISKEFYHTWIIIFLFYIVTI